MPNVLLQAQISATKLNSRRVCMLCLILSHILQVNALKEKSINCRLFAKQVSSVNVNKIKTISHDV